MSSTVILAEQVPIFPLISVTVNVTVFAPRSAQLNASGATAIDWMPQLSLEPLFICAAVMVAFPALFNCTMMFWQIAVGAMLSCTVTVAVQVAVFPLRSVTVNVTKFGPMSEQSNTLGETVIL